MAKVILVGASGYLGGFILRSLLNLGCFDVLAVGRSKEKLAECPASAKFRFLPLGQNGVFAIHKELEVFGAEVVVNCAAMSSPKDCEASPVDAYRINFELNEDLQNIASRTAAYFCTFSSDLVFDGCTQPPQDGYRENDTPRPLSVYAKTKFKMEQAVLEGTDSLVIRSSLVYGPQIGSQKGILGWMWDSFKAGKSLTLFEDEWRSPVYIGDMLRLVFWALKTRPTGLLHCSGPERVSRLQFGLAFAQALGFRQDLIVSSKRGQVVSIPPRPQDVSLNSSKALALMRTSFVTLGLGFEKIAQDVHPDVLAF